MSADAPVEPPAEKPVKGPKLADAAKSSDPLVQKLLWDRGAHADGGVTFWAHVDPKENDRRVAAIDAELAKLGYAVY